MAHLTSNPIPSRQQIVTTDQYHYLAAQRQAITQTKASYGTAMVVSLELYLSQGSLAPSLSRSNDMIERFLECLQGSIDHAMISRSKLDNGLGLLDMTGRGLMSLIKQAWAKTLGISFSQATGLVACGQPRVDYR